MAKEVYDSLRKKQVQDNFLEMGGAKILASWLDILPDGTHPNFNLVNGMLNCIATLQIDSNQLEESGLDNVVSYYESNDCKNPEL